MIKRDEKIEDRGCAIWEKMSLPHGADWDHWDDDRDVEQQQSAAPPAPETGKAVQQAA
jgi:hypothetical protein